MKQWQAAVVLVGLVAACGQDSLSPTVPVMVGAFGTTAEPVRLLASRAGVEFDGGCSSYFVSREAARTDQAGLFSVRGKLYNTRSGSASEAVLAGVFDGTGSVDFTLQIPPVDPQTLPHRVLHEGERYTGIIVCPA